MVAVNSAGRGVLNFDFGCPLAKAEAYLLGLLQGRQSVRFIPHKPLYL